MRSKRERSSLPLLLMGALRCLGRGWTFDDLEENAGMSREFPRIFFRKCLKFEGMCCMIEILRALKTLLKPNLMQKNMR